MKTEDQDDNKTRFSADISSLKAALNGKDRVYNVRKSTALSLSPANLINGANFRQYAKKNEKKEKRKNVSRTRRKVMKELSCALSSSSSSSQLQVISRALGNTHFEMEDKGGEGVLVNSSEQSLTESLQELQLERCFDKRDYFFGSIPFQQRQCLQLDEVAMYSVTKDTVATEITRLITEELCSNVPIDSNGRLMATITDATACVGGNVWSFSDKFAHVHAVECDTTRYGMLCHNLTILRSDHNVTCWNENYLELMWSLHQDVVFIDPPWGGQQYREIEKLDLYLVDIPLCVICDQLRWHAKLVFVKAPTNFDLEKLKKFVQSGTIKVFDHLHKKMIIIMIDYRE
uniref:Trimethylguanosine synthase n=1 Tax=Albugo laibachii Nc14 TaxID=890382 RepID=F0W681_9STRA|nr:conserved hypothetical protein [Albugo laibachii Nc14]|eukprot:CCA16623.1 conserved hypothetical protein [Albugo laibachii Nc14]